MGDIEESCLYIGRYVLYNSGIIVHDQICSRSLFHDQTGKLARPPGRSPRHRSPRSKPEVSALL